MTTLTIRTLRTDGTVTTTTEPIPANAKPNNNSDALLCIGSAMRRADPTVAACRADEITPAGAIPSWTWTGHQNDEQAEAVARAERESQGNW